MVLLVATIVILSNIKLFYWHYSKEGDILIAPLSPFGFLFLIWSSVDNMLTINYKLHVAFISIKHINTIRLKTKYWWMIKVIQLHRMYILYCNFLIRSIYLWLHVVIYIWYSYLQLKPFVVYTKICTSRLVICVTAKNIMVPNA